MGLRVYLHPARSSWNHSAVNDSHTPYTTWVPDVCLMVASGQTKRIWEHTVWARSTGLLDLWIKLLDWHLGRREVYLGVHMSQASWVTALIDQCDHSLEREWSPDGERTVWILDKQQYAGNFVPSCEGEAYALPELSGCTWSRDPII